MTSTLLHFGTAALLCLASTPALLAQQAAPSVQMSKLFGGSNDDHPTCIIQTADKGYLMSGWALSNDGQVAANHSAGFTDSWIVKTDSAGNMLWSRAIGSSGSDHPYKVTETPKAYLVGGTKFASSGDFANMGGPAVGGYLAWLNRATGVPYRIIPYSGTLGGELRDVRYISENRILLTGSQTSNSTAGDARVTMIDSVGKIIWDQTYGYRDNYHSYTAISTVPAKGGGFIMVGHTDGTYGHDAGYSLHGTELDVWLVRLDSVGNKRWSRCYGGVTQESAIGVTASADGGFVVGGNTKSPTNSGDVKATHGDWDFWMFKTDSAGAVQWSKTMGGGSTDRMNGMAATCDNGVLFSGHAYSTDGDVMARRGGYDAWLIRMDSLGNVAWQQTYGSTGAEFEAVVTTTRDGGYAIAATSGTAVDNDVAGTQHGSGDYWLAKLSPDGRRTYCEPQIIIPTPNAIPGIAADDWRIYPNPANDRILIDVPNSASLQSVRLCAVTGQVVRNVEPAIGQMSISTSGLAEGIYYLQLQSAEGAAMRKVVVRH